MKNKWMKWVVSIYLLIGFVFMLADLNLAANMNTVEAVLMLFSRLFLWPLVLIDSINQAAQAA